MKKTAAALSKIFALLASRTGHDFSGYKPSSFRRRLERRLSAHKIKSLGEYAVLLDRHPAETQLLFQELLIGVTQFFRDPEAFHSLEKKVIPKLFTQRPPRQKIRIWCAGSSTGEEPYSIAILLAEHRERIGKSFPVTIFATDMDAEAIAAARRGVYPAEALAGMSPKRRSRFFTSLQGGSRFQIHKSIRDWVVFSEHDLIRDPPFFDMDLCVCRNLLIYLGDAAQKKIVPIFHFALRPGGFLFLGNSESIGTFSHLFSSLDAKAKLFCSLKVRDKRKSIPTRPLPDLIALRRANAVQVTESSGFGPFAEKALLQRLGITGVLVTEKGEILYRQGPSRLILDPKDKSSSSKKLLPLTHPAFRKTLSLCLERAKKTGKEERHAGLKVKVDNIFHFVNLSIYPEGMDDRRPLSESLFLIVLEETAFSKKKSASLDLSPDGAAGLIETLRRELRSRDDDLKSAFEELETSNEELKSTVEELQSINEEQLATLEELARSKEALEAVNRELRKTQKNLLLSKEKYFVLYDRAPAGYLSLSLKGEILETNLAAAELFGLRQTQLPKRMFTDFVSKEDLTRFQAAHTTLLKKKQEQNLELRLVTQEGVKLWVRVSKTLAKGEDGRPIEHLILIPIDEAKKLEEKRFEALRRAESALSELNNQKFILDQHAIVAETDTSGRITYVNDKFCSISGYSREELLGRNHRMINSGHHPRGFFGGMWETISSGRIWHGEICNRAKDGSLYWVDSTIAPIPDASGKPKSYIAVRRDITDSKRLEGELRRSEQLARDLLENFPGMVAYWRSDLSFVFANQYFLSWFSKSMKEMAIAPAHLLLREILKIPGEVINAVVTGENRQFEQTFVRPDGETRNLWAQVLGHRVDGKPTGFFVMVSDVTEIKQAEAKRNESQAHVNLLVRSANIGLWDWNLLTGELFLSAEWKAQIGYTDDEIENALGAWHRLIHPDDLEIKLKKLEAFRTGVIPAYEIEYRMRHKDGSWRWILARGDLVKDNQGQPVKIRGSHVDITERKRTENEILRLNNSLEERVKERTLQLEKMQEKMISQERMAVLGELAGSVAHELRNPLGVISNSVFFLKMIQKEAPEKVREYLGVIESEIRTSDKIVSDLLSFAIFSSIDRKPLSLRDVLEQTISRHPGPPGVRTILEIPDSLPDFLADRQHLLQIFSNLVVNAYQAMPEGGTLTMSGASDGAFLSIRFHDTGHGISPDNKKRIFQPLFTTKIKGIGLGLAVCKKLIEANGGELSFDSEIGKGTWFQILLPLSGKDPG